MQPSGATWQAIDTYIGSFADYHDASFTHLYKLLEDFAEAGTTSQGTCDDFSCLIDLLLQQPFVPNYAADAPRHITHLSSLLADQPESGQTAFLHLMLRVLRVLYRNQANRAAATDADLAALVQHLRQAPRGSPAVAAECASVVSNLCHERANVRALLRCGAVAPLAALLGSAHAEVQAAAAGALQSICSQEKGRQAVRDADAIPSLIALLPSSDDRVAARAAGAMHNLSCDQLCVRAIRCGDGLASLVTLLRSPAAAGSAAGAVQNLSREAASRQIIQRLGAVQPLAQLLLAEQLQVQVCAAGALLNIQSPLLETTSLQAGPSKESLGRLMTCALTLSIIERCIAAVEGK